MQRTQPQIEIKKISCKKVEKRQWLAANFETIGSKYCTGRMERNNQVTYWCVQMIWFCMWQIKLTFMQCNIIKVIWTFLRMKVGFLLQFYCCQGIAKFHIEIFIRQMHLTHSMKQYHVQWAEIGFERYYRTFIWLTIHRLQKTDTKSTSTIWKVEF